MKTDRRPSPVHDAIKKHETDEVSELRALVGEIVDAIFLPFMSLANSAGICAICRHQMGARELIWLPESHFSDCKFSALLASAEEARKP